MSVRFFTLDEANALLPVLRPVVANLLARRGRVAAARQQLDSHLEELSLNLGGPLFSQVAAEFVAIERLVKQIRSHGCLLKDINVGLIDFLAEHEGREVYLCWRYDEAGIEYFHELHQGFNEREAL